ncbi:MAG: sugar ABC transporter permease [Actinomycetes bacterium]
MSATATAVAPPPSASDATGKKRRGHPGGRQQRVAGWSLTSPFMILFIIFAALPVVASFAMSFTDMRSTDISTPFDVNFVGLRNYAHLFTDEKVQQAAINTAIFVVIGVPVTLFLSLIIAVGLNSGVRRLATFFRVGYYLPAITSIVAVAVVWKYLYAPDIGLINTALAKIGITGPDWLNNPNTALPAVIIMAIWRNIGSLAVIFLAGLQAVDRQLYEAASVDGAGFWGKFRYVTIPSMRPTLLFGAVITGVGYLQFFEEPFVMTQGGPLNRTLSVAYESYNQFGYGNYGYSAAIAYALFMVIVILTVIQFKVLKPNT